MEIFLSSFSYMAVPVYSSGSIPSPVGWPEPEGWTGPDAVLYWSFNNLDDDIVLMEGTQEVDFDALTEGKVDVFLPN